VAPHGFGLAWQHLLAQLWRCDLRWPRLILPPLAFAVVTLLAYGNAYYAGIIIVIAIAIMLTVAVNLSAYAGVIMFATGGLYGIGAYTYADLCLGGQPTFVGLIVAGIAATAVGFVIIMASLRLQGIYFALSTLIGNLILSAIFLNVTTLTAGPRGIANIPPPAISLPGIGDFAFVGFAQTCLVLAILALWMAVAWRLITGRRGAYLEAIRNDDMLSMTLGIDVLRYRLMAFLPAAAMMGVAGALYAGYTSTITPDNFDIFLSFTILTFVNVGGRGTFIGPIVAAILLSALVYVFQPIYMIRNLLYGSLLVAVILISPDGLIGIAKRFRPAAG
jgi:branched-chain amino acid transport system permease protein